MEKIIYYATTEGSEDGHGLFSSLAFTVYMDRYKGAELVDSHISHSGENSIQIYHIVPQGVTLRRKKNRLSKGQMLVQVSVDLFGKRNSVSEIEKRILKAAERFEKSGVEVPVAE